MPVDGGCPRDRNRWKLLAPGRVAAERSEREVIIESRRAELQPRARLDVAGQEREPEPRVRRERLDQLADAGEHPRAAGHVARESAEVVLPERGKRGLDGVVGQAEVAEDRRGDLRIGAPGEIVAIEVALVAVHGLQRLAEGIARRPADADQRAVDVEENERHSC